MPVEVIVWPLQWREGELFPPPPPPPVLIRRLSTCQSRDAEQLSHLAPQSSSCGRRKLPGQGGIFRPLRGLSVFFVAGVKLTSLALKLGSTPCSEAVFAICHSLAPSLEKFTLRISYSRALGWETRVRAHCIFAQLRGAGWPPVAVRAMH